MLQSAGWAAHRVLFTLGDRFLTGLRPGMSRETVRGGLADWSRRCRALLDDWKPDVIILFGSSRPIHEVARKMAALRGIRVLSLEEGYIRPGFVTVEDGGNNADSPLCRIPPVVGWPMPDLTGTDFAGARSCAWHAFLHYGLMALAGEGSAFPLSHRSFRAGSEAAGWIRAGLHRLRHGGVADRAAETETGGRPAFLVALQVPGDLSLLSGANGWTQQGFIRQVISSFAVKAPAGTDLVFRIHPLDRGRSTLPGPIRAAAEAAGIGDRVVVTQSGSLGRALDTARGFLTLTSSSALVALMRGVPVLTAGRAIHSHPGLAWSVADIDRFWTEARAADADLVSGFLARVRREALVPGDFHAPPGRREAKTRIAEICEENVRLKRAVGRRSDLLTANSLARLQAVNP
ncbi:hypothetical protein [Rhodobacter sp. CZR27]|uniref:capsular polysaccharide export protein, LipB/KpsS family n=1 Tax=Rhodobacter sp. CZR27 TaxID=2033869 RepID=UPI0018E0B83E|nr:hypothetical protein [Rhodobacter sp. CZR27]